MNIDEMNINDIFNQDNATMLINTDPLTGEHVETEQEWTAAHERELLCDLALHENRPVTACYPPVTRRRRAVAAC